MQQELKKFNNSIEISVSSVSVDLIASKLMDMMDKSNPNAALLVNTVIGSSLSTGKIGFIYNAINGWIDEINITVGKQYIINGKNLDMYMAAPGEKNRNFVVTAKLIDEYRDGNKVYVEFIYTRQNIDNDQSVIKGCWVDHNALEQFISTKEFGKELFEAVVETMNPANDGPKIFGKIDLSEL